MMAPGFVSTTILETPRGFAYFSVYGPATSGPEVCIQPFPNRPCMDASYFHSASYDASLCYYRVYGHCLSRRALLQKLVLILSTMLSLAFALVVLYYLICTQESGLIIIYILSPLLKS